MGNTRFYMIHHELLASMRWLLLRGGCSSQQRCAETVGVDEVVAPPDKDLLNLILPSDHHLQVWCSQPLEIQWILMCFAGVVQPLAAFSYQPLLMGGKKKKS